MPDAGGELLHRRRRYPIMPSRARRRASVRDAGAAARVAAVLGELLEAGDLRLALDANRVVLGQPLDQPLGSGC